MSDRRSKRAREKTIIGPDGEPMQLSGLPPAKFKGRWIAKRKAQVVKAVDDGLLTEEEACARWQMTHQEYLEWERAYRAEGTSGLRITYIQKRA